MLFYVVDLKRYMKLYDAVLFMSEVRGDQRMWFWKFASSELEPTNPVQIINYPQFEIMCLPQSRLQYISKHSKSISQYEQI